MSSSPPTSDLAGFLQRFAPVDLDEIVTEADLQTRKDRKYLLPLETLDVLHALDTDLVRVLTIDDRRRFEYRSTYFDSPELHSYLGAARRRPARFKVRVRHYVDTRHCMLEVKTRNRRGLTVKHRQPCDPVEETGLTPTGRRFVADTGPAAEIVPLLSPSLTVTYDRSTLLVDELGARVTIDTGLTWHRVDQDRRNLGPLALVETKTDGRPCIVDRLMWEIGHRPVTISKYCTGMATLHPHLPANKWNRVLRHHLDWRPDRTGDASEIP